jgi:hypothetical protein
MGIFQSQPVPAVPKNPNPLVPMGYDQQAQAQANANMQTTNQLNPLKPGFLSNSQTVKAIPEAPATPPMRAFQPRQNDPSTLQMPNSGTIPGLSNFGAPAMPQPQPATPPAPTRAFGMDNPFVSTNPDKFKGQAISEAPLTPEQIRTKLAQPYNFSYDSLYSKFSPDPKVVTLFKKYFPDPEVARKMAAIAMAESSGNQNATNTNVTATGEYKNSKDTGLFQMNDTNRKYVGTPKTPSFRYIETPAQYRARMKNLDENFKAAAQLLKEGGFDRWTTHKTGAYKQYLASQ